MIKVLIVTFAIFAFSTPNQSLAEDEDYETYDSIVGQLSSTKSSAPRLNPSYDPFDNVRIHAGVGMALSMTNLQIGPRSHSGLFQGIELNFGIDLFSDMWMAQGTYRNLGRTEIDTRDSLDTAELNEFDLMLVHRPRINRLMRVRTSGGVAARYLNYYDNLNNKSLSYKTPAWALSLGLESSITKMLTFTADVSYRSAMVDDTIDDNSIGAGLRVDANF